MGGVAFMLLAPSSALAGVRAVGVDDPVDVPKALNPPNMPDLSRFDVVYDDAGSVAVTLGFYEDIRQRAAGFYSADFSFILGRVGGNQYTPCEYILDPAKHLFSATISLSGYATGQVSGFTGTLNPQTTISPDGRTISATFANAALAGQDYQ